MQERIPENVYENGRLEPDIQAGRVRVDGVPVKLQAQEYRLLCYLVRNEGRVLSREELTVPGSPERRFYHRRDAERTYPVSA